MIVSDFSIRVSTLTALLISFPACVFQQVDMGINLVLLGNS
jgi:hypothetical protein